MDEFGFPLLTTIVHIRMHQRNGHKCITTLEGLSQNHDFKKIFKHTKDQLAVTIMGSKYYNFKATSAKTCVISHRPRHRSQGRNQDAWILAAIYSHTDYTSRNSLGATWNTVSCFEVISSGVRIL